MSKYRHNIDNNEKNKCLHIHFSAIAHLQKASITANLENVPIPNLPLLGENIIFSNKTFQVIIFEKNTHY